MPARRRWAPVAASISDRTRALGAGMRLRTKAGCHNDGYRSARPDRDRDGNRSPARFACVEQWRESMSAEPYLRSALLNPVTYEP
jgi:hypothetical protein